VAGSRPKPYRVSLRITPYTDAQWTAATHALARQLRHAAALLDGRMPEDIDETLDAVGLSLFPGARELTTTCSCPDVANPCKHVAAVHYTLAQTFDADPFLLPALRGRDRTALLAGLRAARTGGSAVATNEPVAAGGVAISSLSAPALFDAAGDLTALTAHPCEPIDANAALRRLGPPPGFDSVAAISELVGRAATRAWRLAQEHDEDDPLLSALRERGSATAAELGADVSKPATEIRLALRALMDEGVVHRTRAREEHPLPRLIQVCTGGAAAVADAAPPRSWRHVMGLPVRCGKQLVQEEIPPSTRSVSPGSSAPAGPDENRPSYSKSPSLPHLGCFCRRPSY
jgi:SWIM zinc finger